MTCTVCRHPKVTKINEALMMRSMTMDALADRYGVSKSALYRHRNTCIPQSLHDAKQGIPKAEPTSTIIEGGLLLEQAGRVHARASSLLDDLETGMRNGIVDPKSVISALKEVRSSLETLAKFNWQIADRPVRPPESERPEIDEAIMAALEARGVNITEPVPPPQTWEPPALGPAT